MNLIEELEKMVGNVTDSSPATSDEIARWQHLFWYTYDEAVNNIENHKNDLARVRISDEQWETIGMSLEFQGFDKLSYEHKLVLNRDRPCISQATRTVESLSPKQSRAEYVVMLSGPLSSPEQVRLAAGLPKTPPWSYGGGTDRDIPFCCINGVDKQMIMQWLKTNYYDSSFTPTFTRVHQMSEKDLSSTSIAPTLGIDR